MEHDLIRRSKLLAKKCMIRGHLDTGSPCPSKVKAVPVDVIEREPAVDAVPVRHGRWDDSGRYRFENGDLAIRCTGCGCSLREDEFEKFVWNYCPVCGAKMDLKGETEDG